MQKWVISNADMQSTEQVDIMTACFAPLFGGCDTANTTDSIKLTLKRTHSGRAVLSPALMPFQP